MPVNYFIVSIRMEREGVEKAGVNGFRLLQKRDHGMRRVVRRSMRGRGDSVEEVGGVPRLGV